MSGKGKRKKTLKRTGGPAQNQAGGAAEKAEELFDEAANGNGEQGGDASSDIVTASVSAGVVVDKSGISVSADVALNGESSGMY